MVEPAPRSADADRIAVIEKLRPKAERGSSALRAGVSALSAAEIDALHDVDIEGLNGTARAADERHKAAHG